MYKFEFKNTSDSSITIEGSPESYSWMDQAKDFYYFLVAQGYLVSESDLAECYQDLAEAIGDLRSNKIIEENNAEHLNSSV